MEQRWGNYTSCCRLCLDDKLGSLSSIFEDVIQGRELVQQILTYVGIEVKPGDKLTTMICEQCLSKICMWNAFKKSCFENQTKLTNWLDAWEANNSSIEIHIKQEDQSFEAVPMDEDIYEDEPSPPPLTPCSPENVFVEMSEADPLLESDNNQKVPTPTTNGVDPNSVVCSICSKRFSSKNNRRRHEANVHKQQLKTLIKDPLATPQKTSDADSDVQKIQFAAGLQLTRSSNSSTGSGFTNVEIAYLEKYKSILKMSSSLVCVCHNEEFKTLQDLFNHLKTQRNWFAMFTCYNCLITYYDRVSYLRHYCSCKQELLFNLRRITEFSKNSEVKIRIYQNFKCLKCNITFAFYEDFCNHLDDAHLEIDGNLSSHTCYCSESFDDLDQFKQHINVSCFIDYFCDACFTSYPSLHKFKKHCEDEHDTMDGNTLDLYDYYTKSKVPINTSTPKEIVNGQIDRIRTRRSTLNMSATSQTDLKATPKPSEKEEKNTPTPKKVVNSKPSLNSKSPRPTTCPECSKEYSSYHNMLRHYTQAHDEHGLILKCSYCPERFRLQSQLREHEEVEHEQSEEDSEAVLTFSCPDCKEMFGTSEEWKQHIETHPKQKCEECGKRFNLKTDLEQHRTTHLNIKVYRDSKTHNYKSAMLSPTLYCSVCTVSFATKKELQEHKLLHEEMPELSAQEDLLVMKEFNCEHCKKDCLNQTGLSAHIKKYHSDNEVREFPKQCEHCDKVLLTRGAYGNHQRMHVRLSGVETEMETPRSRRTSGDDSESYFTCKKCFKVFSSKSSLKGHMKSHGININGSSRNSKVLKTYWCDICHQACLGYAELQEHKQEHRQIKPKAEMPLNIIDFPEQNNPFIFGCDMCSLSFSTNFALMRHREKHDQDSSSKQTHSLVYCKYCKISFSDTNDLTMHMSEEHDEMISSKESKPIVKNHACKICKKVFSNGGALSSHLGWHKRETLAKKVLNEVKPVKSEVIPFIPNMEITPLQCTYCALQFVNATALQIHILEAHRNIGKKPSLSLNCSSCCVTFDSKNSYDTHMEFHKVIENNHKVVHKPFSCKYCPTRFSRKDRLRGHIKLHHSQYADSIEPFKCSQCDRTFDKEAAYIIHLKVHERHRQGGNEIQKAKPATNKNFFNCSICKMGFALGKDLRTHVITAHPF